MKSISMDGGSENQSMLHMTALEMTKSQNRRRNGFHSHMGSELTFVLKHVFTSASFHASPNAV